MGPGWHQALLLSPKALTAHPAGLWALCGANSWADGPQCRWSQCSWGLPLGSGGGRDLLLFEPLPRREIWQNPKGNGDGTGEESSRGLLRKRRRGGRWLWAGLLVMVLQLSPEDSLKS